MEEKNSTTKRKEQIKIAEQNNSQRLVFKKSLNSESSLKIGYDNGY